MASQGTGDTAERSIDQELLNEKEYSELPIDLQKITTPPEMVGDAISGLRARMVLTTPRRVMQLRPRLSN